MMVRVLCWCCGDDSAMIVTIMLMVMNHGDESLMMIVVLVMMMVITDLLLFLGPVASVIINCFGCRCATIFGGILSAAALIASTWSPSVVVFILVFGGLGGKIIIKTDCTNN